MKTKSEDNPYDEWLDEEWLRQVAEKHGIGCTINGKNFECDFESLKGFACEVGFNFILLANAKDSCGGAQRSR